MAGLRWVFEGGIEVSRDSDGLWHAELGYPIESKEPLPLGNSPDQWGLRPVFKGWALENGEYQGYLLSFYGDNLELQGSIFSFEPSPDFPIFYPFLDLTYDVRATLYHCKRLVHAYATICRNLARLTSNPDPPVFDGNIVRFPCDGTPYFEFDALLSAARRSYDKAGNVLWAILRKKGGRPDNFEEALDRLNNLPEKLAADLRDSWRVTGVKLKDYRDCTQHFVSLDLFSNVTMKRFDCGLWRAVIPIPDNPGVKSKKKFSYASGLDVLSYGWTVTNEIVSLRSQIMSFVLEKLKT